MVKLLKITILLVGELSCIYIITRLSISGLLIFIYEGESVENDVSCLQSLYTKSCFRIPFVAPFGHLSHSVQIQVQAVSPRKKQSLTFVLTIPKEY